MNKLRTKALCTICLLLAASVIVSAQIDIETYRAPEALTVLSTIGLRAASPGHQITKADLPFLDPFPGFSLGVLLALEALCPITSWNELHNVEYHSVAKQRNDAGEMVWTYGEPRKLMTTGLSLTLYTFFTLPGAFIFLY